MTRTKSSEKGLVYVYSVYPTLYTNSLQQVPRVEQFGSEKRAIAKIVMELRGEWSCRKNLPSHETCIDARGEHVQLTVPRLEDWARQIVYPAFFLPFVSIDPLPQNASDGQLKVTAPPPDEILDQWNIGRNNPISRPRGRCSPYQQPPPVTDSASLSLATAGLLTAITGSITRRRSPSPEEPRKRVRRDIGPSPSPPPPVGEELRTFLNELFLKIRRPGDMRRVYDVLDQEGYTPEALVDDRLDPVRIGELTRLPGGAILSMQSFARKWCEENKVKKQFRK